MKNLAQIAGIIAFSSNLLSCAPSPNLIKAEQVRRELAVRDLARRQNDAVKKALLGYEGLSCKNMKIGIEGSLNTIGLTLSPRFYYSSSLLEGIDNCTSEEGITRSRNQQFSVKVECGTSNGKRIREYYISLMRHTRRGIQKISKEDLQDHLSFNMFCKD